MLGTVKWRAGVCTAGTNLAMQGLFSLMLAFESISDPVVQRQLLEHSLQLLDLSKDSKVRLLRHEAQSAEQLMGLLRSHAPETLQDDHLLMLQGPLQDMVLLLVILQPYYPFCWRHMALQLAFCYLAAMTCATTFGCAVPCSADTRCCVWLSVVQCSGQIVQAAQLLLLPPPDMIPCPAGGGVEGCVHCLISP